MSESCEGEKHHARSEAAAARRWISRPIVGCFSRRCRSSGIALVALATLAACGGKQNGPSDAAATSTGERVYQQYCAVCHMPDGGGVPNFQPALRGSAIVSGDPARLEAVIRAGSAALRDREPQFSTEMPPFGTLSEEETKAIVAYVRERFGEAGVRPSP